MSKSARQRTRTQNAARTRKCKGIKNATQRLGIRNTIARLLHRHTSRHGSARARTKQSAHGGTAAVAVFFDAENISANYAAQAAECATQLGQIRILRAYGGPNQIYTATWQHVSQTHGYDLVSCNGNARGKNSADIRIVVDAMDMLERALFDTLVVVSNDSDFTPLARYAQAKGLRTISMVTNADAN